MLLAASKVAAPGSGIKDNLTGKLRTGYSVKDSDVWQNQQHEWRTHRIYQGQVKAVILDWAGTVLDSGVYSPAVGQDALGTGAARPGRSFSA